MNFTSLEDKAISHLNCDNYHDTYDKFKEIEKQQTKFNESMNMFLDSHRKRIRKIVESKTFTPNEESLNMLLRFIFYKARTFNLNPTGVGSALDDFNSFVIFENDSLDAKTLEISNPFPDKEDELKKYLTNNHENIFESIENFGKDVEKIKRSVKISKRILNLLYITKLMA